MNRLGRLVEANGLEADQRDSAEQRDPCAVELKERQPPEVIDGGADLARQLG